MAKNPNMIYYLTKKIRIKYDGYNYIPEIICSRQPKNEQGEIDENAEPILAWGKFGYYVDMKGAINRIIELYPSILLKEETNNEFMSFKKYLTILNEFKKQITVKVLTESDKLDEIEEENDVEQETKGKSKRAKSLSK